MRIIFRICINVVIILIKVIKLRKLRFIFLISVFGLSIRLYIRLLIGIEIVSIMIIVIFKLNDVLIFFDIVKNVYIFRKKESVMFLMKIDFISRLI